MSKDSPTNFVVGQSQSYDGVRAAIAGHESRTQPKPIAVGVVTRINPVDRTVTVSIPSLERQKLIDGGTITPVSFYLGLSADDSRRVAWERRQILIGD